ncbi:NAD(P)-dependent alcohol dehydrogenase [Candidatus Leptofilum sp.]|uniref:NAD(P)-dependent alcohol dehydrogenase n=1 Tax=Candidatus Leptofilum sp. TaxID=3241576 RepID=UPI003B5C952F
MKAVVYKEYGPPSVLKLQEVAKPIPKENEILVKIHAASLNFGDLLARKMNSVTPSNFTMPSPLWLPTRLTFGWSHPRNGILGSEFAGDVEAVGSQVTEFKVGDAVFGYRGPSMGANAEYICVPADSLAVHKPANMSYDEAATVPYGGLTALSLLQKVNVQPGQKMLINGASGSIGAAAVQLAKHFGAEVTGICGTPRLSFVRELGADHVIDYTQNDFTQNGKQYDLIFDILGKQSFAAVKGSLTANGRYLLASFKTKQLRQMVWTSIMGGKKVICALSSESRENLLTLKELIEAGAYKAIIDRRFPLAETAVAHQYVETGHKQGPVVITMNGVA